ncbi:MAG: hypothetical protein AAFR31_10910 [Cyanobacteria bacterium J06627_8]
MARKSSRTAFFLNSTFARWGFKSIPTGMSVLMLVFLAASYVWFFIVMLAIAEPPYSAEFLGKWLSVPLIIWLLIVTLLVERQRCARSKRLGYDYRQTIFYRMRWGGMLVNSFMAWYVIYVGITVYHVHDSQANDVQPAGDRWLLLLLAFILLTNRFYFFPKWRRYRVLILRKFGVTSTERMLGTLVLAGRVFGRCVTMSDADLRGPLMRLGGGWFIARMKYIVVSNKHWKPRVKQEAREAAVVILDATEATPSLEWELEYCKTHIQNKLVILSRSDNSVFVEGLGERTLLDIDQDEALKDTVESLIGRIIAHRP